MTHLLLTVPEAAEALAISRSKLYELMASGAVASIRIDGSRRIPLAALEEYVARLLALLRHRRGLALFQIGPAGLGTRRRDGRFIRQLPAPGVSRLAAVSQADEAGGVRRTGGPISAAAIPAMASANAGRSRSARWSMTCLRTPARWVG